MPAEPSTPSPAPPLPPRDPPGYPEQAAPAVVAARAQARAKHAYDHSEIAQLDRSLRERTPRIGLWLDNSAQTPEQTVAEITERAWTEAAVP